MPEAGVTEVHGRDGALRALVEALAARRAGAAGRPEILETHLSVLWLTGRHAYKFKKPVRFAFVDFGTLEQRRRACREEVRLNRRLTPELYLGVVRITATRGGPRLGGRGSVLEYAVKMRRFDRRQELGQVLAGGRLRPAQLTRLAEELADFHAAVPADRRGRHGGTQRILDDALENFATLRGLEALVRAGRTTALERATRAAFARHRADFAARRRAGRVREGHGDLHLGNMVMRAGRIRVFDCLEFNEALRWADVASDIAFLLMDLEHHGHPDLGRLVLSRYLEHGGDYGMLRVLGYYLAYRAAVRAKVAALRGAQAPQASAPARSACEAYLDLGARYLASERYATPRLGPALIITHGLSGSGKSWLAERLVTALGAVRVRTDAERRRALAARSRAGRAQVEDYSLAALRATYARVLRQSRQAILAGYPVIVDATFVARAERERFRRAARRWSVPFAILDVSAPYALLRRRVSARRRRGADLSQADERVLADQRERDEALEARERALAFAVDTGRAVDLAALADRLVASIGHGKGGP